MRKARSHVVAAAILIGFLGGAQMIRGATTPARPNILFVIADDWSFGHASSYGCRWVKTPGFDRVARDGILFTHAYTPNAKCAPSRACILTGRNSWQLEQAGNHMAYFPPKFKTFVESLGADGYFSGYTGKGWGPGVATSLDGKPRDLTGRRFDRPEPQPPTAHIYKIDYAGSFQSFLDAAPPGQPWCFWYGAFEPHRNYEYGSGVSKGGKALSDVEHIPPYWPDNETVRHDLLDYAYEVEHFDRHLVRMLAQIEARGELARTLVVVTSDHGMPFPRVKGQAYEASNHVPLAIMWPDGIAGPGREVDDYISLIDLAPTFLEAAGIAWDTHGMAPTPGHGLGDIFRAKRGGRIVADRDHVLIGKERHDVGRPHDWGYPIRGIVRDETLYLRNYEPLRWPAGNPETGYLNCDGSPTKTQVLQARRQGRDTRWWDLCFGLRPAEELYDLSVDSDCLVNLADDPAHRGLKDRLRRQMEQSLRDQHDPRMIGRGDVFDRYPYSHEGTRNFHQRLTAGEGVKAGWVNDSDFEDTPINRHSNHPLKEP